MARLYSALLEALQRQVCHRDAAQYGQTDIGKLHRLGSPTVTRSARKQCPRTDDLLTTGLLEGRDVLESTDCQTQVKFGQEGSKVVGEAFRTTVRQGIRVRATDPHCRRSQREGDIASVAER